MATSGLENGSSINNNISFQSQKSSTSTATPSSLVSINSTPKSSNINLTNDDESEDIDEDFDIDEAVDGDHSSSDDADDSDDDDNDDDDLNMSHSKRRKLSHPNIATDNLEDEDSDDDLEEYRPSEDESSEEEEDDEDEDEDENDTSSSTTSSAATTTTTNTNKTNTSINKNIKSTSSAANDYILHVHPSSPKSSPTSSSLIPMLSPPRQQSSSSSASSMSLTNKSPGRIHEIVPDVTIAKRTRSTLSLEEHRITDLEKFLDEVMLQDDGAENDVEEYERFLRTLSNNMESSSRPHSSFEDDDEDDVDFDPRLDPSALEAMDDPSPLKAEHKIQVNKDEWKDLVKDAHLHFIPKGSKKAKLFRPQDIQNVHILLQQLGKYNQATL